MLVYGDAVRTADPREVLDGLRWRLASLDGAGAPVERHAWLAALFIAAAELAQGLADAAMAAQGGDGSSPEEEAALKLVSGLAGALVASWRALGEETAAPPPDAASLDAALGAIERLPLPPELQLKTAEGYAFYALYPEAYAAAAGELAPLGACTVVGIRSIGSGLAAVAAQAVGAARLVTVRPVGHPFQRHLKLQPRLKASLKSGVDGAFVLVDEGPGLSGSSFGAVADALEDLGAPRSRIAFLPGHGGDLGEEASAAHRARWAAAERRCVSFDALVLNAASPGHRLQSWFADLAGGREACLHDISGGGWRVLRYADEAAWPASNTQQERRKFLLEGPAGVWLLKFVGLGATGERALAHAEALAGSGFAPEASALRYGFLAQPWLTGARPLQLRPEQRQAFAKRLGEYLGWRARSLKAPEGAGASLETLREMARVNAVEALGNAAAAATAFAPARWAAATPRRVWTDNRLHAHEWLEEADGVWLKTDGVDHAAAHDLIGAQDIAWDVAGARVEFDLDSVELAILLTALEHRAEVDPDLVDLLEPAYLAFQLGAYSMAAQAHGGWPQEHARLARAAAAYRRRLAERLGR